MARVPYVDREKMDAEGQEIYDRIRNDRNSPAGAAGSFAVTTLSGDGEFVNQVDEISAHVLPTRIPPARSADAIRHKRPANATGEEVR